MKKVTNSPEFVFPGTLSTFSGPRNQFTDPQIPEQQVGRWIMSLNNDCARLGSQSLAGILMFFSRVDPVADLITVDPDC